MYLLSCIKNYVKIKIGNIRKELVMKRFYAEQAQKSSKRNNACLEVSTSVVVGWWWGGAI